MRSKLSAIEEFFLTLPKDLQEKALQAIEEETARFAYGAFTEEEGKLLKLSHDLSRSARKKMEEIVVDVFSEK